MPLNIQGFIHTVTSAATARLNGNLQIAAILDLAIDSYYSEFPDQEDTLYTLESNTREEVRCICQPRETYPNSGQES